jgi:hypothetical protein
MAFVTFHNLSMCLQGEDNEVTEAEYRISAYQFEQEGKLTAQVLTN